MCQTGSSGWPGQSSRCSTPVVRFVTFKVFSRKQTIRFSVFWWLLTGQEDWIIIWTVHGVLFKKKEHVVYQSCQFFFYVLTNWIILRSLVNSKYQKQREESIENIRELAELLFPIHFSVKTLKIEFRKIFPLKGSFMLIDSIVELQEEISFQNKTLII